MSETTEQTRLEKNARIRSVGKATRDRRANMVCQVRDLKIVSNHLSKTQQEQLTRIFLEAKWLRNAVIGNSRFDKTYLKELDNKVPVILPGGLIEERNLVILGARIQQSVVEEVKNNLRALFRLKKKGYRVGALRFCRECKSINLSQLGNTHKIDFERNRIKILKISGWIRVRGLNQIDSDKVEFANAKLVNKPDGYHLLVTTYTKPEDASGRQVQSFQPGTKVGIDMGLATHLTLSDGTKIKAKFEETDRLKKLSRKLNRQIKGSANYRKTLHQIHLENQKITNRKNDCANKIVHELLKNEQVFIQDEMISLWKMKKGYVRGGRSIQHSVLGRVKSILVSHPRVTVLPRSVATTATCICGKKTKHLPGIETFVCLSCGYTDDRDVHAAKNMVRFGSLATTSAGRTRTLAEIDVRPTAEMDFSFISGVGCWSKKQEG